jgi:hypothetical protein
MFFLNHKEVNYKYYYKNTLRRIYINKTNKKLNSLPKIKLFFWFRNVMEDELNLVRIHNHILFFWLITNQIGQIKKFNKRLHRGIRYCRFIYMLMLNYTNYFLFLNCFVENIVAVGKKNSLSLNIWTNDNVLFIWNDLTIFTNLRLSVNLYLNSINDKLYLQFFSKNNTRIFVDLLKLNAF